jgi:hypothetical protein
MRSLRQIRENPVLVCCVILTGLIAWVGADLINLRERSKTPVALEDLPYALGEPVVVTMEVPFVHGADEPTGVSPTMLPQLKLGMTRIEVEELLGPPSKDRVMPVSFGEGRLTYHMTYDLSESDRLMTIRPIKPIPRVGPQEPAPASLLALEFDASLPGHPLIRVHYPDPLF